MKTLIQLSLVFCLCGAAFAQGASGQSKQAAKPATEAKELSKPPSVPKEKAERIDKLRKKHMDAILELKKKQGEEMKALKETMRGKSAKEIKSVAETKRKEHYTAIEAQEKVTRLNIDKILNEAKEPEKKETPPTPKP